jgi:hypothetical protein
MCDVLISAAACFLYFLPSVSSSLAAHCQEKKRKSEAGSQASGVLSEENCGCFFLN